MKLMNLISDLMKKGKVKFCITLSEDFQVLLILIKAALCEYGAETFSEFFIEAEINEEVEEIRQNVTKVTEFKEYRAEIII